MRQMNCSSKLIGVYCAVFGECFLLIVLPVLLCSFGECFLFSVHFAYRASYLACILLSFFFVHIHLPAVEQVLPY